jgi:hypothetical protein
MKITAFVLAVPLVLGAGLASAQTTTTKTIDTPLGSVHSSTTTDPGDLGDAKTVQKHKSVSENPDGTVTTQHSKTVTRPD